MTAGTLSIHRYSSGFRGVFKSSEPKRAKAPWEARLPVRFPEPSLNLP